MKALRVILIIVLVLVAAVLIVPLFSPATAEVSAETTIALAPEEIFPTVASFNNRFEWDPWYTQDSTADVRLEPLQGYVGSTYSWEGEKIGTGRMEVISIKENEYIESSLWFGEVDTPSLVEWHFEALDGGTKVTWSFSQETTYPIGRLGMIFGKIFLKQSFELGLVNLKEYMETNPPAPLVLSTLSPIEVEAMPAMFSLVADGAGTMETIGQQLGELYGMLFAEAGKQGLDVVGAAFVHYLDYDESTGFSNYRAGVMVNKMGSNAGVVNALAYPSVEVVKAVHKGPYEEFSFSYDKMAAYVEANAIEISGEAFEFYQVGVMQESQSSLWETLIAFPLK